jgi:hypothetical protein
VRKQNKAIALAQVSVRRLERSVTAVFAEVIPLAKLGHDAVKSDQVSEPRDLGIISPDIVIDKQPCGAVDVQQAF